MSKAARGATAPIDHPPTQAWKTEGIATMERPGAVARLFMAIVEYAERLNSRLPRYGSRYVYDNATFPWSVDIERNWHAIREELDRVLLRKAELPDVQEITPDADAISYDAGWKIFPLIAYGVRSQPNIALCPRTWGILQRVPGLKTAMFSILEPGKRIPPHRGPYNGVLRLHLGLMVPEPRERLGIRVGHERRHWQEGRVLIFDDAFEHEVWNEATRLRVVLFVDFAKPLRFPANVLNGLLLRLARFSPLLREGADNLRRWEGRFHGRPSRGTGA